jgi:ribosome-associated heat shock protein Hsp15
LTVPTAGAECVPQPRCAQSGNLDAMDDTRLDKWLWAARFYKTRGLAQEAIGKGQVLVRGEKVKVARVVRVGDEISVRIGDLLRVVQVLGLSGQRGPAPVAQRLYQETEESVRQRVQAAARRALAAEPADAIEGGRPTKRDRRQMQRWRPG